MKATGIIRRFDDLGRIVIPKELRRNIFGTQCTDGKPMEFFIDGDSIILKKYEETKNTDAEEQELFLRLRAGVGSKVYDTDGNEFIVKHFTYYSYMQPHFEYEAHNEEGNILRFKDIHIDKFIFLTREEALKAKQEGE